ncbi:MAG: asparagine synthase (glutamine-hydrolyzing) [Acidobacteria bacterium]|nr:asparagine synthase (glutamine-hydrolyzing) [Acidobacteriota bacterium]
MCGIAGSARRLGPVDPGAVRAMRDAMAHRGPDDSGEWFSADRRVGLGHRRLAIIDLGPGGHQPMVDPGTGAVISFNGEIYNYRELRDELLTLGDRFVTNSDTEVLLAAYRRWGADCLSRLNGMFAFGIFDPRDEALLLARDRAGEKPLVYRLEGGALAFASELKALLAAPGAPRRLDPESLDFFLAYGYVPESRSLLAGYAKLPQGHALRFDLRSGSARVWPYWSLPEPGISPDSPAEEAEAELGRLLLDSVKLRMIADVPVGILLSGGIDSSLVTAMAARVSPRVKTFTISFPGHGRYDEAPEARRVAEHFGTDHAELVAEPASTDLILSLVRQFDEPIADSSLVPTYLVSRAIRRHATVALGGDGGDELFGGYRHYDWLRRHEALKRRLPRPIRRALAAAASRLLPVGTRGRNYAIGLGGDALSAVAHVNIYFDAATRRGIVASPLRRPSPGPQGEPEAWRAGLAPAGTSLLQQATRSDFRSYLADDVLAKVDRASMLVSLEVRAPWLDPRIIEFAFGRLPDSLRADASGMKILPRRLAAKLLPPGMHAAKKQGFSVPLGAWFRGDFGRFVESVLADASEHLLDRAAVRRLVALRGRGLVNEHRLFALAMLELWRREYRVDV